VDVKITSQANGCLALSKTAFARVAPGRATMPNALARLVAGN
jgi:hypothetical protein